MHGTFHVHRDPNSPSSFKVAPGPSSAGVILLSGAGRGPGDGLGPVSVSLDRQIGAVPICVRVAKRAEFFRCACSEQDTSLSGSGNKGVR